MENNKKDGTAKGIVHGLISEPAANLLLKKEIAVQIVKEIGYTEKRALELIEEELQLAAESFEAFKKRGGMPSVAFSVIGIDELLK